MVDGIKQKPMEGVSMVYTFDKANANAASTRKTQYFEMIANRGIYHDGWYASTTPPHGPWILNAPLPAPKDYKWELYNLNEDYSQANDLAAKMPDKLKQMQALFDQEAAKYQVLPLNNDTFARALAPRPSATAGKTVFTYTGVIPGIPVANAPNILGRSYTVTAEVDVPQGGGNGMLATAGGRWGGWGLYLLNGKPVFNYNMLILAQYQWVGQEALTPGKHSDRLRLHLRRPRHRQGRQRRAEGRRQGRRHRQAGQLDRVPAGGGRDLRRRRRHAHRRERQGLPGAVRRSTARSTS